MKYITYNLLVFFTHLFFIFIVLYNMIITSDNFKFSILLLICVSELILFIFPSAIEIYVYYKGEKK